MKSLVSLKVQFIFDPETTWNKVSDFEKDLGVFFTALDKEGQRINSEQNGDIIVYVSNIDKLDKARTDEEEVKDGNTSDRTPV